MHVNDSIEIRWHGRGGQGAITAAKIVARAAFESGYPGVVMIPTFGTERRGAPVITSLKIARQRIYDLSVIEEPDIVVVLDHLLLREVDVTAGLKKGGLLIINTPLRPDAYPYKGIVVATADVNSIARQAGLPYGVVNTGVIGALARATNIFNTDIISRVIEKEFEGRSPDENVQAALITYENTQLGGGMWGPGNVDR